MPLFLDGRKYQYLFKYDCNTVLRGLVFIFKHVPKTTMADDKVTRLL